MSRARMGRSALAALALVGLLSLASAGPASAHPLGNFSVNSALIVAVGGAEIWVQYVADMAEIPAFRERQAIDRDGDERVDPAESRTWASAACDAASAGVELQLDGRALSIASAAEPQLSFPAGAGDLETLRLVCSYRADLGAAQGRHQVAVRDAHEDARPGWREITIGPAPGGRIVEADVPAESPSAELTAYPEAELASPLDVRAGWALVELDPGLAGGGGTAGAGGVAASLVAPTAGDALAGLVASAAGGPVPALLAALLSIGLGAAHAISPGHGKALIAAYVIGSRGTLRQGAVLGLTVAVTHTLGVFVLGLATLAAGTLLAPDGVLAALSVLSGIIVLALGAGLVIGALRRLRGRQAVARHGHSLAHEHGDPGDLGDLGAHGHSHTHRHDEPGGGRLRPRNVLALGLAGGMVPSASALIVLLVALTTGQLALGLLLIAAFGAGMAVVLGGLAVAVVWLQRRVAGRGLSRVARLGGLVPLASGLAVLVAGAVVTAQAVARFA